jgi:hypothetical protein
MRNPVGNVRQLGTPRQRRLVIEAGGMEERVVMRDRAASIVRATSRTTVIGDRRVSMAGLGSSSSGGNSQARCRMV